MHTIRGAVILSTALLFAIGCTTDPPNIADRPDPAWDEVLGTKNKVPLTNIPEIVNVETTVSGNLIVALVTVKNAGNSALQYTTSSGPHQVNSYREIHEDGRWKQAGFFPWCGTATLMDPTAGRQILAPGDTETLVVVFTDPSERERILARFAERGTDRRDFVILATEKAE